MIPAVAAPDWNHRNWWPLWRAISETGLPVVVHTRDAWEDTLAVLGAWVGAEVWGGCGGGCGVAEVGGGGRVRFVQQAPGSGFTSDLSLLIDVPVRHL